MNSDTGKWIMIAGGLILFIGSIIYFFHDKLHWIGKLPGDIRYEREGFKFYFPITTMLLASIFLSLLIRFIQKFLR